jgi:hypothetical protein
VLRRCWQSHVDACYCSTRCCQAAHRAGILRVELAATAAPLRLEYADPPYPGNSDLYRGQPDNAGEVDHEELLSRLQGGRTRWLACATGGNPSCSPADDSSPAPPRRPSTRSDIAARRRSTRPDAVIGAKPPDFCCWLFGLLGALPGDSLDDVYPGSGIVTWAWQRWTGLADEELVPALAPGPRARDVACGGIRGVM